MRAVLGWIDSRGAAASLLSWIALGVLTAAIAQQPFPPDHVVRLVDSGTLGLHSPLRWYGTLRDEPATHRVSVPEAVRVGAAIGLALDHLFDRGHSRIAVPALRFVELVSSCLFVRKPITHIDKPPQTNSSTSPPDPNQLRFNYA